MKILMLSTDKNIFDQTSFVYKRMLKYSKIFDELHIIVYTKPGFGFFEEGNLKVYPTNSKEKFLYYNDVLSISKKISDVDVVTTQDPFETGVVGGRVAKRIGAKLNIQIHTDFMNQEFQKLSLKNKIKTLMAKKVLTQADSIRVVSERIKRSLINLELKNSPTVLPIMLNVKDDGEIEKPFKKVILSVARLEPEKNVSLLIEAFKKVSDKDNEVGLVILGSGTQDDVLKKQAKGLGISDRILFRGNVENVSAYYGVSDVYVQTSKYEGYGMAIAEAAYFGLPIVSTDVGLVGDVLKGGESVLIAHQNPVSVFENIIYILENKQFGKELGSNAKKEIEKHSLSESKYLDKYRESLL